MDRDLHMNVRRLVGAILISVAGTLAARIDTMPPHELCKLMLAAGGLMVAAAKLGVQRR